MTDTTDLRITDVHWIDDYIATFDVPEPHPDISEALLADPHLRHISEAFGVAARQEEGLSDVAMGIRIAVAGTSLDRFLHLVDADHEDSPADSTLIKIGYALGRQIVFAVEHCGRIEVPEEDAVEPWLARWRAALDEDGRA